MSSYAVPYVLDTVILQHDSHGLCGDRKVIIKLYSQQVGWVRLRDNQEVQLDHAHLLYKGLQLCATFKRGNWSITCISIRMYVYTNAIKQLCKLAAYKTQKACSLPAIPVLLLHKSSIAKPCKMSSEYCRARH